MSDSGSRHVVEYDPLREAFQFTAPGFSAISCGVVQVFEYLLRCAHRLLKNIVDAGQPFHRLVEHQQRDHETR